MSPAPLTPVSFDFESFLIFPGCLTPRVVCGSWKVRGQPAEMATREGALDKLVFFLSSPEYLVVGANIVFDLSLLAAERPETIPIIFAAIEAGRVSDVAIRQALIDIADGMIFQDRVTGGPQKGRYGVVYLAKLYLGLDLSETKVREGDEGWEKAIRLRYSEMDGKTLEEYPEAFRRYSLEDAEHELAIWEAQADIQTNLSREPEEVRAAWSLHLMSIRGIRTDEASVTAIAAKLEAEYAASVDKFVSAGIYKINPCKFKPLKEGQAERVMETADVVTAAHFALVPADQQKEPWYKTAKRAFDKGKPLRFGENSKVLECLTTEAYFGSPPKSDKGNVKTNRDTLIESGNDLLEEYGESTNTAKLLKTYLPILRQGIRVPVNAKFNVLVESLRTSGYDPNLQNLPK